MYNILDEFINHDWITTATGEQGYILAFSCIIAVILVVKLLDLVGQVFSKFVK